jgi:threonine/homoserine/homoserine lactone efflux protein
MLQSVASFLPLAALLAVSPGPATAMVIHSAARGGRPYAVRAVLGNATGLGLWAAASMLGVSALVVASETAYTALKICGAILLIAYGIQAIRSARRPNEASTRFEPRAQREASRVGLVTALANSKVALFYVALLPQFVPADQRVRCDASARGHPDRAELRLVSRLASAVHARDAFVSRRSRSRGSPRRR